jgi:DNA-binding IclR family transcriptional regulator
VGSVDRFQAFNEEYLAKRLREAAAEITRRISQGAQA